MRLCIVLLNYKTPMLVLDALASLAGQVELDRDCVVVVDNASGDGSADRIEAEITARGIGAWVTVVRSSRNGGFAAGNNLGIRSVDARYYLLLNSDTIVRPGAIATLLSEIEANPQVGIAGPRLEWPDGTPQNSCFRDLSVWSELISAAGTGPISALLRRRNVSLPMSDASIEAEWISFACALIRREVIDTVGLLDEGYFMYFEDSDYCRAARMAGFTIRYFPNAHVVHLRGGSSEVKRQIATRKRPPRYYYASRTRYYRKLYGRLGPFIANGFWLIGRSVSWGREFVGHKTPHICEGAWLDNWIDVFRSPNE